MADRVAGKQSTMFHRISRKFLTDEIKNKCWAEWRIYVAWIIIYASPSGMTSAGIQYIAFRHDCNFCHGRPGGVSLSA